MTKTPQQMMDDAKFLVQVADSTLTEYPSGLQRHAAEIVAEYGDPTNLVISLAMTARAYAYVAAQSRKVEVEDFVNSFELVLTEKQESKPPFRFEE